MTKDIDGRDESTPRGHHVESSDDQPTQDEPGTLNPAAGDVSPVTKSQDSPVNVADSSLLLSDTVFALPAAPRPLPPGPSVATVVIPLYQTDWGLRPQTLYRRNVNLFRPAELFASF